MYPYYKYVEDKGSLLHEDDIAGIRSLYGRQIKDPVPTTRMTTRSTPRWSILPTLRTTTSFRSNRITTRTTTRVTTTARRYVPPCEEVNDAVFIGD
jgi:hypothetical protein